MPARGASSSSLVLRSWRESQRRSARQRRSVLPHDGPPRMARWAPDQPARFRSRREELSLVKSPSKRSSKLLPLRAQNAIPFTCERSAPKGQGAHPAQRAGRGENVMATLTLALVRCYGLFCRAFLGHAADPRHQLASQRNAIVLRRRAILPVHPPRRDRDCFSASNPEARPSWRAELSRRDG